MTTFCIEVKTTGYHPK